MATITVLRARGVTAPVGAERLVRDAVLQGSGGANVKFAFDFGHPIDPLSAAPTSGRAVYDLAEVGNGDWAINAGQTLAWDAATEGVNFAGLTAEGATGVLMQGPVSVGAAVQAAGQKFMQVGYFTMPTREQYNGYAAVTGVRPMMAWSSNGYTLEADLVTVGQFATGTPGPTAVQYIASRRQTNGATTDALSVVIADGKHLGKLAQLAFWRNDTGQALRVRSADGTDILTAAVGSNNAVSVADRRPMWGVTGGLWSLVADPTQRDMAAWKLHRGWVETMATGAARDPAAVLDADWTRNAARFTP